jgi:hypothetical protein
MGGTFPEGEGGPMAPVGKFLIVAGLVLIAVGIFLMFSGRIGWFGRLPGDIVIKRDNFTIYFPLATSILISIILSILIWLFRR